MIELHRKPGTCCPEPGCDSTDCSDCEYFGECWEDCQKADYCRRPLTCVSCGADCTHCDFYSRPILARGNII